GVPQRLLPMRSTRWTARAGARASSSSAPVRSSPGHHGPATAATTSASAASVSTPATSSCRRARASGPGGEASTTSSERPPGPPAPPRSAGAERLDGLGQRQGPPGLLDVQVLDHPAVDGDDAAPLGLRLLEGVDDAAGPVDLLVGRGEHPVAGLDLAGVDERLAVEAHLPAL